jgi:hypothetical protein
MTAQDFFPNRISPQAQLCRALHFLLRWIRGFWRIRFSGTVKKVSNREYGLHVHALRGGINRNEYAPGEMLPVHYFYLSIFLWINHYDICAVKRSFNTFENIWS